MTNADNFSLNAIQSERVLQAITAFQNQQIAMMRRIQSDSACTEEERALIEAMITFQSGKQSMVSAANHYQNVESSWNPREIPDTKVVEFSHLTAKGKRLVKFLLEAQSPKHKSEIIEFVWQLPYESAYDNRLYKLVERVKKRNKLEIINSNNHYFLDRS